SVSTTYEGLGHCYPGLDPRHFHQLSVKFLSFTLRQVPPHIAINQLLLYTQHQFEIIPVEQQPLLDFHLLILGQLAKEIGPETGVLVASPCHDSSPFSSPQSNNGPVFKPLQGVAQDSLECTSLVWPLFEKCESSNC